MEIEQKEKKVLLLETISKIIIRNYISTEN